MPLAIETSGLTRVYRGSRKRAAVRAVDRVDLQVEQGEVVALLGPNGAGKTTMVRLLACLLRPNEGTAQVAGHDISNHPDRVRASCGVSTETPGLYERLTAIEYLVFFARLYSVPEPELAGRVQAQLEAAGLWDRRDDRLAAFSKGMRQKMNIGRALLHRPQVVFLDEPTSGLDVEAARAVRQHIQALSEDGKTTFVICTHNLPEAERLCTRIAVMNQGHIVATGAPEELKRRLFGQRVFRARLRQVLPRHQEAVSSLAGIEQVRTDGNELIIHISAPEEEVNPLIVRRLVESGAELISLSGEGPSLEEVYLHLVHQETPEQEEAG
jgi:ABC-2 type transport system ATP-binding protein